MNVFAKFDEIPSMLLQDIKETKRFAHTFVRSDRRTDNVKTVYPPTNTVQYIAYMLLKNMIFSKSDRHSHDLNYKDRVMRGCSFSKQFGPFKISVCVRNDKKEKFCNIVQENFIYCFRINIARCSRSLTKYTCNSFLKAATKSINTKKIYFYIL